MDLHLNGKRALVTGSSSGIGTGIARELAREGASVVVHGRNRERAEAVAAELRAEGLASGIVVGVAIGDLATDEGADAVAAAACEALGGIDILVNNAGGRVGTGGTRDWLSATEDEWAATYQANTVATVRLVRRLAPAMVERGWGRLIQFASTAGHTPSGMLPHYAAAKAGIINMTMGLAQTFAHTGVTANTISPGMIATPAVGDWFDQIAADQGFTGPDATTRAEAWAMKNVVQQMVARVGQVRDIAAFTAFLCSPLADFITGANFRLDGGRRTAVN